MTTDKGIASVFVPLLGDLLAKEVAAKLKAAAGDGQGWRKAALTLVIDAVAKEGLVGLATATDALFRMADGETPKIDWTDLGTASDILAAMENAEAGRKTEVEGFLTEVGQALGIVCVAAIRTVL